MRFIALLSDWLLYSLLVACMAIGGLAIHAPDTLTAYPLDTPPTTEAELLQTMDTRVWP